MRWFWLFVLVLIVLTGGLSINRVRTKGAIATPKPTPTPMPAVSHETVLHETIEHPAPTPMPIEPNETKPIEPIIDEPVEPTESVPEPTHEEIAVVDEDSIAEEPVPDVIPEPEPEPETATIDESIPEPIEQDIHEPIADPVIEVPAESVEPDQEIVFEDLPAPIEVPAPAPIAPTIEPDPPSYTQLGDGSFKIIETGVIITGDGTSAHPFMLDWVTLRAIERVFNPKKGKNELPDWLDLLNESHVRITGNTLVPVIASTTRELLVMQNPWDGCCVGIPPSPYDAIEVSLNHDVDFGSSAVGFGTVEGVFILDPYVVDGWVLGIYMIEEATYRSGEGVPFPDF